MVAQSTGTIYYPNGGDEPDEVNNVEKIIITDTLQNETYTIQVGAVEQIGAGCRLGSESWNWSWVFIIFINLGVARSVGQSN